MLKILGFCVTIFNKLPVLLSCVLTWTTLPLVVPILPSVLSKYNLSSPPEAFSRAINQTANNLACFKVNNCIQLINGKHNRAGCWIRQPSSHRAISRCPWLSASTNKQLLGSLSLIELNVLSAVRLNDPLWCLQSVIKVQRPLVCVARG